MADNIARDDCITRDDSADIKNYTREWGSPGDQDWPDAEFDENRGYLIWDSEARNQGDGREPHVQVYIHAPPADGSAEGWGYSLYINGRAKYSTWAYDTHESATMAGLFRVNADVRPNDPRISTASIQMCRELYEEVKELREEIDAINRGE